MPPETNWSEYTNVRSVANLPVFNGWKPEDETGYLWFDVPLDIEGLTEHGLFLHGGCYARRPDCHVTFEVRIARTPGKHCTPLGRLDWRDQRGGHTNKRIKGHPLSGKRIGTTHLHAFDLNWRSGKGQMLAGLPMAQEISEPLQTFEATRGFAGKYFKINNIAIVTRPEWDYNLFQ